MIPAGGRARDHFPPLRLPGEDTKLLVTRVDDRESSELRLLEKFRTGARVCAPGTCVTEETIYDDDENCPSSRA